MTASGISRAPRGDRWLGCAGRRLPILACAALAACSPELNWRETRVEGTELSLTFPCRPAEQHRTAKLAERSVPLSLHVCDSADSSWALLWAPAPDPASVGPMLRALNAAAAANLGAAPPAPAVAVVRGATPQPDAGRWLLQGRGPDGQARQMAVLTFAHGLKVFQATVIGPAAAGDPAQVFFGSVRAGS